MLKNLRNLASRKANKAQKQREETIKQSKNKKKKTTEIIPEQEPDILKEDVSEREKETTSEEESVAESTIIPPKANSKRKRQDEVTLQPADSLNLMFRYFDKSSKRCKIKLTKSTGNLREKGQCTVTTLLKVKVILFNLNSTRNYKMIFRTFLTTKISTSRPFKLWTPSFLRCQKETNW